MIHALFFLACLSGTAAVALALCLGGCVALVREWRAAQR